MFMDKPLRFCIKIQKEMRSYIQSQNIETFVDLSVTKVASDGLTATLIDLVTGEIYSDNCLFFSPNNASNDTTYYGVNKIKTGLVPYS